MQETLWQQGMDLMLFGMGTVFVFLTLLVIGTMIMSTIITNHFAEEPEPVTGRGTGQTDGSPVSTRTLAVIQAAISAHRAKHNK